METGKKLPFTSFSYREKVERTTIDICDVRFLIGNILPFARGLIRFIVGPLSTKAFSI
jgi:hypothetical protein